MEVTEVNDNILKLQILRSLSKVLNSKDSTIESYCITNTSRPLLSYGPRGAKGGRRTFLYVEALKRFKVEAKEMDLDEAYKRARPMYNGRMEHTFVVLRESRDSEEPRTGANAEPIGNKRPAPEDDGINPKKKAM